MRSETGSERIALVHQRNRFTRSRDRLKRGRELYMRLVRGAIARDPTVETLKRVIKRAVSAGLYSDKTATNDIAFSILNYMHQWHRAGGDPRYPGLYQWLEANGWSVRSAPLSRRPPLLVYHERRRRGGIFER